MNKPIFFITGPSGSGKTTIISFLKTILPKEKFEVRNFDEFGVPAHADQEWRLKITEKWLQISKENSDKGMSTVICGITLPEEARLLHPDGLLYFILLDANDEDIRQRLAARYSQKEMQDDPIVISGKEKFIHDSITFAKYFRDIFQKLGENAIAINTSNTKPEETAREAADWILAR